MERHKTVQDYIESQADRKDELLFLRDLLLETELKETVKWGAPCYTIHSKNVIGLASFKSYTGLWFHQGVFLTDKNKVLINAQEGTTKALRQWRFQSIKEMNPKLISQYILEAIQNQKDGKEIKAVKAKKADTPLELKNKLSQDNVLKSAFDSLTSGKQREYAEHIGTAKQEKTRLNRLEKAIPMILKGEGLNDKYK
jgi:uncharacterized protein YdeI (YjbR/CyaY-like superfamily)